MPPNESDPLLPVSANSGTSVAAEADPVAKRASRAAARTHASLRQGWRAATAWMTTFLRFVGPGFMVGVGYLDPGNWATDLASGSEFGYSLLYIVFLANLMAVVLQYLCIKLGVVTGLDLAMACRKHLPPWMNLSFYVLCQLAIIATDLAEVVGTAIALQLLFGLPLLWGVALTGLDVLVILAVWDTKHLRSFEYAIIGLVGLVALAFVYLLALCDPDWGLVARGLVPTSQIFRESGMLYLAVSVIGATIMPHNLYLHSSIVRYRAARTADKLGDVVDPDEDVASAARASLDHHRHPSDPLLLDSHSTLVAAADDLGVDIQPAQRKEFISDTIHFSNMDSVIALTGALLVNSAILIVSGASFHNSGEAVGELQDAYELLVRHLGPAAGAAFATALLFAGQSSTITGTLTGQIIAEGFLGQEYALRPWMQRLLTRSLAIVPAMVVAVVAGDAGVNRLLVLSQVVLSLQLPFAIWPLVWFTSDRAKMTVAFAPGTAASDDSQAVGQSVTYGATSTASTAAAAASPAPAGQPQQLESRSYENSRVLHWAAVAIAVVITVFNVILIVDVFLGVGDAASHFAAIFA
ncbi:hypothetical protein HK405_004603 [Cladochytrium tenue]|nr:hypothetical protein HK405_004603 [Cladochytrium tenue]